MIGFGARGVVVLARARRGRTRSVLDLAYARLRRIGELLDAATGRLVRFAFVSLLDVALGLDIASCFGKLRVGRRPCFVGLLGGCGTNTAGFFLGRPLSLLDLLACAGEVFIGVRARLGSHLRSLALGGGVITLDLVESGGADAGKLAFDAVAQRGDLDLGAPTDLGSGCVTVGEGLFGLGVRLDHDLGDLSGERRLGRYARRGEILGETRDLTAQRAALFSKDRKSVV